MKAPVGYAPASKSFVSALENRRGYWCGCALDNALNQRFAIWQNLFARGSVFLCYCNKFNTK